MADGAPGVELEQAALACLLLDPESVLKSARALVRADLFTVPLYQRSVEATLRRSDDGSPVDAVLVAHDLEKLGEEGAFAALASITRGVGTSSNGGHYFEQLERNRAAREASPIPVGKSLAPLSIGAALAHEETRLERGVERLATGWERLDSALGGGFTVPSLNILGAGPKSGKSTMAQVVAVRHVERGGVAYVLDLENGRRRYLRQLLCRHAQLGGTEVARALQDHRAGVFTSRAAVERWRAAKAWVSETLAPRLFAEFTPPRDLVARLREVRHLAGDRPLLVVIDSLQKLPGQLDDRRAVIDSWVRLFERLRHELGLVFLVVSEIKRNGRGIYEASESAFKESGGIEYAADLAMTLTRPRADEDEEAVSTLRVELARDCDEDPRGDVASFAPVFPFYGLEERAPAARGEARRRGPKAEKGEAACAFLKRRLAAGPVIVGDVVRDGETEGLSRSVLYRAKDTIGVAPCTMNLKSAWRLP